MSRILSIGGYQENKPRVQAFLESCRMAGHSVLAMPRDPGDWKGTEWAAAVAAVTCGMHLPDAAARKVLEKAGIPLVVLDLGYMKRATKEDQSGYHQAGIGRIGWLPPFRCPGDRWEALGLEVNDTWFPPEEGVILCLGQCAFDSQHHKTLPELRKWLLCRANLLQDLIPAGIVYRPHPLANDSERPGWGVELSEIASLDEDLDRAQVVVTYNSTAGVEAIRRGLPVVCSPSAHYAEVAWTGSVRERTDYFHRLAYAQWNLTELADGTALKFLTQFFRNR